MTGMSRGAFEETIRSAVLAQAKTYTDYRNISFHWETDKTATTSNNIHNFQALPKMLDLAVAQEVLLPAKHPLPGFIVSRKFENTILSIESSHLQSESPRRHLVIIHYADRAVSSTDGGLMFVESVDVGVRKIDTGFHLIRYTYQHTIPCILDVDFVFVWDCIYEHIPGAREAEITPLIVEVIAGPGATRKLLDEIKRRKGHGQSIVEVFDLAAALRSRENGTEKPTHYPGMSVALPCLKLPSSSKSRLGVSRMPPAARALAIDSDEHSDLVDWTRALPPSLSTTLEGPGMKGYHLATEISQIGQLNQNCKVF
ncbi:uncharacterized protein BDV17DRAFT_295818 [Aspergillus undulatus]|uniref:uncharacterized protein n=1 Tax=Aspergillus undulatus TaxID=1810928 RepID=UPI003CCD9584